MNLETLLMCSYTLVPIIFFIGYIPQVWALIKSNVDVKSFPLTMWVLWLIGSVISMAYGAFYLKDLLFCVTCFINLAPQALVVCFVTYHRLGGSGLKVDARINQNINQIAYEMHDERYQSEYIECPEDDRIIAINYALISEQPKTIQ